jgi:hypothetical protein
VNYPLLYLEHLSNRDLELLATIAGSDTLALKRQMIECPAAIDDLLASRSLFEVVFDHSQEMLDPGASTFLAFGILVNRSAGDLRAASYVPEWAGPGKRLPVFDVEPLREFFEDGARRYFLIEFLNSFTTVASGSFLVRTRKGYRRRRFSELDLAHLAEMVDLLPPAERPGGYRRLGDVALFLSGVFPDHAASHPRSVSERERLTFSAAITPTEALGAGGEVDFLETVGAGWYRRAVESARTTFWSGPEILRGVASRFTHARRILNYVSDRFLFGSEQGSMRPTG